ncbi:MAG: fused DSP-PTPase phosphatase/NAD kinase-like protein [Isosphaeraceae bacterium]
MASTLLADRTTATQRRDREPDRGRDRSLPLPRKRRRRAILRTALVLTVVLAGSTGWVLRRPWLQGNLGIVDPGLVVRSAQPTAFLPGWIREYHLRAILNLRGGGPSDWWYGAVVKAARDAGVAFYDLPLGATRRPGRAELLVLIDTLQSCPYPLLIHCKSGADRTGLASAVYRMVRRGVPPEEAEDSFTIEHLHIPIGGPEHLHEPLREYGAWLAEKGLSHTPERFRDWVKNDYKSPDGHDDPPPLPAGPRHRRSVLSYR